MKFLKENALSILGFIALVVLISVSQIKNDEKQTAKAEKQGCILTTCSIEIK